MFTCTNNTINRTECFSCENVITWNIEGLRKYHGDVDFKNYLQKFDIISLVETFGNFVGEFNGFYLGILYLRMLEKGCRAQGEIAEVFAFSLKIG